MPTNDDINHLCEFYDGLLAHGRHVQGDIHAFLNGPASTPSEEVGTPLARPFVTGTPLAPPNHTTFAATHRRMGAQSPSLRLPHGQGRLGEGLRKRDFAASGSVRTMQVARPHRDGVVYGPGKPIDGPR